MPDLPDPAAVEHAIRAASFEPLGWLLPAPAHSMGAQTLVLVGNAGPAMYERLAREREPAIDLMDSWTRDVLTPLAHQLGARVAFPFDQPFPPFLQWAKAAGAGFTSPLGLNIRPDFGLWHAFRAAFLFDERLAIPAAPAWTSPCESCLDKPCLSTCPVSAFSGTAYDVAACASHLAAPQGKPCREQTCMARLACPVAPGYRYGPDQMRFHMRAFMVARGVNAS